MSELLRFNSLQKKTMIFIIGVTVLCTGLAAFIVSAQVYSELARRFQHHKTATMESLSSSLMPLLELYEYNQLERTIHAALTYEQVVSVTVRAPDGALIRSVRERGHDDRDVEVVKQDIVRNGVRLARLEVGFSRTFITRQIRKTALALVFGLSGFFVIMGYAIYNDIKRNVIRPLGELSLAIDAMNPEDLSARAPVGGDNELGVLAAGFNRMAERLEAEHHALRRSEERFRTLVETMNDGLMVIDSRGYISYANPSFREMLGYDEGEVRGLHYRQFVHEASLPVFEENLNLRQQGRGSVYDCDLLRRNGDVVNAMAAGAPLVDAAGDVSGSFAVFRDVTEHRRAQKALARSEKHQALATLTMGLSHEIKNPIAIIQAHVDVLSEFYKDQGDEETAESLDIIMQQTERILKKMADLSMMSKDTDFNPAPVNLRDVLDTTVTMLRPKFIEYEIRVSQNYEDTPACEISGDKGRLMQLFTNLIFNAIESMDEGGELDIEMAADAGPGRVQVRISDTGKGISQEDIEKVFNPFFTTKNYGTGLGLAVCHAIVEDHQGEISIENGPECGAAVTVTLPRGQG